jgi:hypothetical protein
MSKIMRIAVLAMSLVSLFAMLASAAGAATWQNTGDTSFTATAGPGTLNVGSNALTCGSSTATGNAPMSVPDTGSPDVLATGTIAFNACQLVGITASVNCTYALTANTYAFPTVTGDADVTCSVVQVGRGVCHIEGRTSGNYTSNVGDGTLSVPTSRTLRVTDVTAGSCSRLGTGTAHLSPLTFTTHRTGPMIALV